MCGGCKEILEEMREVLGEVWKNVGKVCWGVGAGAGGLGKFFLLLLLAYSSSYHEKATKRCTSSIKSCRASVHHTKMGKFR